MVQDDELRLEYDVVVIGASSAGLFAAELLAREGEKVAVVERSAVIDPDDRTYIITPGIYRVLPNLPDEIISQKIECFQIEAAQEQADITLSSPDLIIDRTVMLPVLVSRATSAGATILTGCESGCDQAELLRPYEAFSWGPEEAALLLK